MFYTLLTLIISISLLVKAKAKKKWKWKRNLESKFLFLVNYMISMLGELDFSLAKASRRSNLYKLSKNQRKLLEEQKKKSRLEKAKRN